MARNIIFDVDTGSDDAVAMMLAMKSPELNVLGICSVNGNRGVNYTTENTLRVVEYMGSDIPVYRGCALPVSATLAPWRRPRVPYGGANGCASGQSSIHGDYLTLPAATIKPQRENAVSWLIRTLRASNEKVTLVPVGPLTNIAMAIRIYPEILEKIDEIVIMGGAYQVGNITATAEFNFWIDPEAAQIVLSCGAKITLVPLDATHHAYVTGVELEKIKASGSRAALATYELVRGRIKGYSAWQKMEVEDAAPIHDALCIAYLLDPTVLKDVREIPVDVDFSGGPCDGMTICDVDGRDKKRKPNCSFAFSADREKFVDILTRVLSRA